MKGMNASWMSSGEQLEELRVVRITEKDVAVEPPVVPVRLATFLAEREKRRGREVSERIFTYR